MPSDPSRRDFLRIGGTAAVAAGISPFLALPGQAVSPSNIQIVDTGHGTNSTFLRALADNGVQTIFRYYAQENNIPGKNITPNERAMIHDHGLSLAIVYQHQAWRENRFTRASGMEDARFCLERAVDIQQPQGSAIFFGVDSDTHTDASVIEYLTAVRSVLGRYFEIGCYGSGAHCAAAINAGVATMSWVAEAPAWGGTRAFINSGRWTLYQNKTQIERSPHMSAGGVPIDTNVLHPRFDSIGAFDRDGYRITYDRARVQMNYDRRMFVAATELNIRERPGGRVLSQMCVARTVHVLGIDNGWALVDTNEDGRPDGYCSAEYLRPLHQMPAYVRGCTPVPI